MTAPSFLLIGAQKAGTTWLAGMLDQHPEIHTPARKELHHFDLRANLARGTEAYLADIGASPGVRVVGEATPNYLGVLAVPEGAEARLAAGGVQLAEHPEVVDDPAGEIHACYPDLDLVVMFRDPVARAVSAWRHHIRRGRISPRTSFRDACGRHGILTMGFYHHHLRRWLELYPRERLLVHIFEEGVKASPEKTIRSTFEHLGVDPSFEPRNVHQAANERASDLELHLRAIRPGLADRVTKLVPAVTRVNWPRIAPTDDDRAFLADLYRDDVRALEALLDRPLDVWESVRP
ncbi:MAG: sulfotransferase domain-containing protein [Actinomycetota bacterium]